MIHEQQLGRFREVTGENDINVATMYLEYVQWNLNDALNLYLTSPDFFEQRENRDDQIRVEDVEELSESMADDLLSYLNVHEEPFKEPPLPPDDFTRYFYKKYRCLHPPFLPPMYLTDAVAHSRREQKFLLLYIHSEDNSGTENMVKHVLSHPTFIDFVTTNFCFWCMKVNDSQSAFIANVYGYFAYPSLMMIDPSVLKPLEVLFDEAIRDATTVVSNLGAALLNYRRLLNGRDDIYVDNTEGKEEGINVNVTPPISFDHISSIEPENREPSPGHSISVVLQTKTGTVVEESCLTTTECQRLYENAKLLLGGEEPQKLYMVFPYIQLPNDNTQLKDLGINQRSLIIVK
ncbi:hypothetical protein PCE1_000048 [Barthelona sp. PCE]